MAVAAGMAAITALCAGTTASAAPLRVGVALDGPRVGNAFATMAVNGAMAAQRAGQATVQVERTPGIPPDPAVLTGLAAAGNQLVIAVGFDWTDTVAQVAAQFPGTDFAIIDGSSGTARAAGLSNVTGILFREGQAGQLAGYLAGLTAQAAGRSVILGAVGCARIPPVQRYIAGFTRGARLADSGARTITRYSGTFAAVPVCGTIARQMMAQGATTVFSVAGPCGDDALMAAKRAGRTGVGVDVDQSRMGPFILTSAIKRVDMATRRVITQRAAGQLPAGDMRYGLRQDAVGLGRIAPRVPESVRVKVTALERRMKASG
jgi:basic membrane protein A and related proteins